MIRNLLSQLQRRWTLQLFLETWAKVALVAVFLAGGMATFLSGAVGWWLAAGGLISAVLAALWSYYHRPTLAQVAVSIDQKAATRDRLATALAFEELSERGPLHEAALAECAAALRDFEPHRWTPWRTPRGLPWVVAAVGGVMLATWLPVHLAPPSLPPDAATVATADRLENLAKTLEEEKQHDAELAKVVEAIRQSASRLRAEATTVDAQKAALQELSSLEAMLEAAQQGSEQQALAQLGEALAQSEATREAGKSLEKGDAKGAAEKLDKAAQEWDEKKQQEEALAKAMQQLAQQLGASQIGSAAKEMSSSLQQQGEGGSPQEALQRLAEAVRQAEAAAGAGQAGNEKLQRMARAVQEMKAGQGQGKPGDGKADGEGEGGVMMVEAPGGGAPQAAASGKGDGATGNPGSERDEGSKSNALGAAAPDPEQAGLSAQLEGLLGEGETLQSLIATTSGEAGAKRSYQAIYEAALPAAQEAVNHEKIPLGSRLLVKRYFESIRPKP